VDWETGDRGGSSGEMRGSPRAFAAGAASVLVAAGCASWLAAPAAPVALSGGAPGSTRPAAPGWSEQLALPGSHHELKRRFGLFGPSIVMQLRSDMLELDPRIDEYSPTRQVFDQLAFFIVLTATVIGLLVLWDTSGLGPCLGGAFGRYSQLREAPAAAGTEEYETFSLLSTFRGLAGSMTARGPAGSGRAKDDDPSLAHGAHTTRSAPGAFAQQRGSTLAAATGSAASLTWTQQMGLSKMPSHAEGGEHGERSGEEPPGGIEVPVWAGLGLEVAWEPTPFLFFVLGLFCQLPLMIALCCYTYFLEMFGAGAGADGLSAFPIIVSVAQLMTAASVATVLREWNWMLKAVLGLLIAVPAILIVPVSTLPALVVFMPSASAHPLRPY